MAFLKPGSAGIFFPMLRKGIYPSLGQACFSRRIWQFRPFVNPPVHASFFRVGLKEGRENAHQLDESP
jgi:hypothetical protein